MDHDSGTLTTVATRIVAEWSKGSFAENLAIDHSGTVFVTLHTDRTIVRIDPTIGRVEPFAQFDTPVAGLAFAQDGSLVVSGGTPGQRPGVIWSVSADGSVAHVADVPDAAFLNGVTPLPDGRRFLVADSLAGVIHLVDTDHNDVSVWLRDDRLMPPDQSGTPGANGVKVFGGHAYVSVTASDTIMRVSLNGAAAGPATVYAERLRADDFALGVDGSLLIATHPAHSLVRLRPSGERSTLAGLAEGMMGATAVAFGRGAHDRDAVYVTTTGGTMTVPPEQAQTAKLVRVDVGVTGHSLLAREAS